MIKELKETVPDGFNFQDGGTVPNNPALPLLYYRKALDPEEKDLAGLFEKAFAENGWTDSWRDGVYPYHHYHSMTHEVLAVYRGHATLALGGPNGEKFAVTIGDVMVIPAGVGHKRLESSDDFGVVGAYPKGSDFDLIKGDAEADDEIRSRISAVPIPETDPLYGKQGPLRKIWASAGAA